jgi:hypothetical protein
MAQLSEKFIRQHDLFSYGAERAYRKINGLVITVNGLRGDVVSIAADMDAGPRPTIFQPRLSQAETCSKLSERAHCIFSRRLSGVL